MPLPRRFWLGVVADMIRRGEDGMGIMTLIMFLGYLRPGEAMALTHSSFIAPVSGLTHWSLMLHPASGGVPSKVGAYDETIMMDHDWCTWMNVVYETLATLQGRDPDSCIWRFTYHHYVKVFNEVTQLMRVKVVPYQARHSGPSRLRESDYLAQ